MKKTLAAILIVMAAVVAVGTFGHRFTDNTAEALGLRPTPVANFPFHSTVGGNVTQTTPLRVNSLPSYATAGVNLLETGIQSWNIHLGNNVVNALTPQGSERIRLMSITSSNPDLGLTFHHTSRWSETHRVRVTAGSARGMANVTFNINGYTCRANSDGSGAHFTPNVSNQGNDPNVSPPTGCRNANPHMTITSATHTIPVWVGYGPAPSAHAISAVNVEETSGDIESISSTVNSAVTDLAAFEADTIQDVHSGEIVLYGVDSNGSRSAVDGINTAEPDRPHTFENFYSRDFSYSLSGATASDNELARRLSVETRFTRVDETGDWQPTAIISVTGSGSALPPGSFTLTLTGRDAAPSGNTASVPVRIVVESTLLGSGIVSLSASNLAGGDNSPVTEDDPLVAYTITEYGDVHTVPSTWTSRSRTENFPFSNAIIKLDDDEATRVVDGSFAIADETVVSQNRYRDPNRSNGYFTVSAGSKEGSTTISYKIRGYVCRDDTDPDAYMAPTDAATADVPSMCPSGHTMVVTERSVSIPIWVGWADPTPDFEITGVNLAGSVFQDLTTTDAVASFEGTVQSNHTGELSLYAYNADGQLVDRGNATVRGQPDRPMVDEDFQGRKFTYKLAGADAGAGDDQAAQTARNMALARMLVVETLFGDPDGGDTQYNPMAKISARSGAMLPPGTYGLTLTGSDDAPRGGTATVPIQVTVTQSNRAPMATVDGTPDGDAKTTHAVTLRERTSMGYQAGEAPEGKTTGDPRVLADFSRYFIEPDNQVLTYRLVTRTSDAASAALFDVDEDSGELTLLADLPDYDAAPYIDLDVDADEAADDEPRGYKFSVEGSDGSSRDSIEVTITVTERDATDPGQVARGTNFAIDENAAACAILGEVEITLPNRDDPEPGEYNSTIGGVEDGLFNLNAEIAATEDCGGSDITAAKTNELMALVSFNHEARGGYQLTVSTDGTIASSAPVNVTINDINEAPMLGVSPTVPNAEGTPVARQLLPTLAAADVEDNAATEDVDESTHAGNPNVIPDPQYAANVSETADVGTTLSVWEPNATNGVIDVNADGDIEFPRSNRVGVRAFDEDAGDNANLTYSLMMADSDGDITTTPFTGPFSIDASTGAITVSGGLDRETTDGYVLYIVVTDDYEPTGGDDTQTAMSDNAKLTINVQDANELPFFVRDDLDGMSAAQITAYCQRPEAEIRLESLPAITLDENPTPGLALADYDACDADGDDLTFIIRSELDRPLFALDEDSGALSVSADAAEAAKFDYESKPSYSVEIEVTDGEAGQGQVRQTVNLNNLNDNAPVWQTAPDGDPNSLSVNENTLRGTTLATYIATDADGDPITYTLSGGDASQYQIDANSGVLATLASLDADRGNLSDSFTVTADDSGSTLRGNSGSATVDVSISINNVDDSISSIRVHQANPVLGTHGDPMTALADRKTTLRATVPEAPTDLPATAGTAVTKFVSTGNARWGSVLRLAVLSQSPDSSCGNGNQCVFIDLEGDDSDDKLKLMAYRSANRDNEFIAAVMPVQSSTDATPGDGGVYKHTDGGVPQIHVEEEDSLRIKFGNLRDSVVIDNEAPEFTNFLPEHEESLDEDEVDYAFTVTDAISGIPDPEDLPDTDGDDNYMSVVGLVSANQCANVPANYSPSRGETDLRRGKSMVANTNLFEGETLWCAGTPEIRRIQDDKDFDETDNGFDVETKVVLPNNRISYVTFIGCDAAGNCVAYDPDENDRAEAFAEITVDTVDPTIMFARTGVAWDASDNTYDDDRNYIQVIFDDISDLNPDTIEQDDFVVDGHTVVRVYWYDDPDDGEAGWDNAAGTDTRFDRGNSAYREIAKSVFLELEEDLLPDATPDVSVVPNGLEDAAGNEQDDDVKEADDWIAPAFTVQSITSPRETTRDNVLVGEDEKVTIMVTSDERISTTKPLVDVNYVNAPAGCVDRNGVSTRNRDATARADCAVSARGASLNSVITKDGTSEWTIVVDKPSATGYYNVYIYGDDRSGQNNRGSEGVAPDKIAADFFEKDGDVNADDAVFFEGDVQLPKPRVVVSGEHAGDTEPEVEQKRPLFIEIDFTSTFSADCDPGDNLSDELNCSAESAEYAEDGFDAVTITKFELDGVDMTDSVKTTDDETFLVALDDVSVGDHEITIQAMDVAGNELKDELDVEFSVDERDPFTRRLNPGWNLVSLPGEPSDGDISAIFTADIEVRTVYTYNPVIPGGWQVAVRETLADAWQGDLTDITARNGYWVLSDAIQDLEVNIPRLAGGAIGASTPIQPPVIPMYAGWNLIPVVDVTGDALDTDKSIDATTYLNSLDDGLDLARVLGFNTITNEWFTVLDPDTSGASNSLRIGSGYWVFVRESASLVPGGTPR